jgi:hypothetical protein
MRSLILFAALVSAPVAAAPPAPGPIALPPELSDPALGAKLGSMMGAMTRAVMDVHVGEVVAAANGRAPTAAERRRTVRDEIGGPAAARRVEQQVAASGPAIQSMTHALVNSLPAITAAMKNAADKIEKATANLPDPAYPRR